MEQEYPFVILVIDDEPPICEIMTRVAKTAFTEASFVNARSAQETMNYINNEEEPLPQLILLDIDLHQYPNGLDLLPKLHECLKGKVPVIMLTVSNDTDNVRQATAEGAVAFTRKPTDLDGWKAYVVMLRKYWYETARVPLREDVDW